MATRLYAPILLAAAAGAILASCQSGGGNGNQGTGCKASGNPIDEILCDDFAAQSYEPIEAAPAEFCTRASIDLLGVRPGRLEMEDQCFGRSFSSVVKSMQDSKEYRRTQRRRWADRFQYSDYMVDIGSIRDLDAMVNDLYKGEMGYKHFVEVALSHPGFVGTHIGYGQPEMVADAAFRAFLGREATTPERWDVAQMWKPWIGGGGFFGGDPEVDGGVAAEPGFGYAYEPMVDPFACEAGVRSCESTLLGPASIEFDRAGRDTYITASDLTDADIETLREPGRLFTSLPMFWEAQVDEVLMRYLGYDLGAMRPDIRQRLVTHFKATGGDLQRLEYTVLTSWLYRQSATTTPARPSGLQFVSWAYGPTKTMIPETFLTSVGTLAGEDPGNCDWRYPNLPDWYYPGNAELDAALDDVYPREADGMINDWFRTMAIQMGGCPGTVDFNTFTPRARSHHVGLMVAVAQEEAVVELCFVRDAKGLLPAGVEALDTSTFAVEKTARHVLERALGPMTSDEVRDAMAGTLKCTTCTAEAVGRDLCAAIATGTEFLLY